MSRPDAGILKHTKNLNFLAVEGVDRPCLGHGWPCLGHGLVCKELTFYSVELFVVFKILKKNDCVKQTTQIIEIIKQTNKKQKNT